MNFKPGDKVWIDVPFDCAVPKASYAAMLIRPESDQPGWWEIELDDYRIPGLRPEQSVVAHEKYIRRRDDPPEQTTPREAVGEWELCPWRPGSAPKEVA